MFRIVFSFGCDAALNFAKGAFHGILDIPGNSSTIKEACPSSDGEGGIGRWGLEYPMDPLLFDQVDLFRAGRFLCI